MYSPNLVKRVIGTEISLLGAGVALLGAGVDWKKYGPADSFPTSLKDELLQLSLSRTTVYTVVRRTGLQPGGCLEASSVP